MEFTKAFFNAPAVMVYTQFWSGYITYEEVGGVTYLFIRGVKTESVTLINGKLMFSGHPNIVLEFKNPQEMFEVLTNIAVAMPISGIPIDPESLSWKIFLDVVMENPEAKAFNLSKVDRMITKAKMIQSEILLGRTRNLRIA